MESGIKTLRAPAKINLCLHVLGRLESGYHEVAMAMQAVDLFDDITITPDRAGTIVVDCPGLELNEGDENIAARAARLLCERSGVQAGFRIRIRKKIPAAAGLGGGSSDAATVLVGLNDLLGLGLDRQSLAGLAAELGADVSFFIYGGAAWATGIGTELQPLVGLPRVAYLLVNPGIAVSTAEIYQSLRLTKGGELANLPRFSVATADELCAALHNDLEPPAFRRFPQIAEIKQELIAGGAMGALMSGSGSTVFGVYDDYETAIRAGEAFAGRTGWQAFPVRPL